MRVLSLGGGQQSTAVYLLAATGKIQPLDYAIFADTGEEPKWVYETVRALEVYPGGAPILVRWLCDKAGRQVRLGDQLIDGNAGRFASIPAFIKHLVLFVRGGKNAQGKGRRQCTREFKTAVVEGTIRRELLGLEKGQPYKGPRITQVFGFDYNEGGRIVDVKDRLAKGRLSVGDFPLWEMRWRREDCVKFLAKHWGRDVLPSACTFCPLVSQEFRRLIRDYDPDGHVRACAVDHGLRQPGAAASKMLDGELYIHRQMIPLADVDLDAEDDSMFGYVESCDGYCGH
jgi:hypothetical protein